MDNQKTAGWNRKVITVGNSDATTIPEELMDWIKAQTGSPLKMIGDTNSKGQRYVAFWVEEKKR